MDLHIGEVTKISARETTIAFIKNKRIADNITLFIDFEKIKGLYIDLDRKQFKKLYNEMTKIFMRERNVKNPINK
jgi:hypothetical protein